MRGRELVLKVFDGEEPPRPPVHLEAVDKEVEARFSDVLIGHGWVPQWSMFFEEGGPFRRGDESLFEWADRLDVDSDYEWPDPSEVVSSSIEKFKSDIQGLAQGKYVVFEVIGPTEQCEYFLMPEQPRSGREAGLAWHRFDFALLYRANKAKARRLYDTVAGYVEEVIRGALELECVDAVRIADDMASYSGPIYHRSFYEELYMPWHQRFTGLVRGKGKHAVLHCDGDYTVMLKMLAEIYDGLHPLDFHPKSSVDAAYKWLRVVVDSRKTAGFKPVYFTGIPIDLVVDDRTSPSQLVDLVRWFIEAHGLRRLVLSSTHRPHPGRSYLDPKAYEKVTALLKALSVNIGKGG